MDNIDNTDLVEILRRRKAEIAARTGSRQAKPREVPPEAPRRKQFVRVAALDRIAPHAPSAFRVTVLSMLDRYVRPASKSNGAGTANAPRRPS